MNTMSLAIHNMVYEILKQQKMHQSQLHTMQLKIKTITSLETVPFYLSKVLNKDKIRLDNLHQYKFVVSNVS